MMMVEQAEDGSVYFDRQEVRMPVVREQAIFHALPGLVRHALDNAPFFKDHLAGVDPDSIVDREALARLPVIRKSELADLQRRDPPLGGLNATPVARLARLFASPGPIFDPEGTRVDYWRFARAMFAAGFRSGDLIYNTFAYHLTPAGSMAEGGARALACPVVAAGTGQSELQAKLIADLRPAAYVGTPSFLVALLEKARELGLEIGSINKALVSGEAFPRSLRERLQSEFAIHAFECYATADLGLIAYESSAREGLIVDEAVILEIVRPGTGDLVEQGEVGEVLVTAFNPDYPLIRFATGDLSCVLPGESACGRTNMRIKGWMGRADQSTKVRGMFVHASQIEEVRRRHAEVSKARLTVDQDEGRDLMVLACEVAGASNGLQDAIGQSIREITGLRGEVTLVTRGSLPNDGKVIDDQRKLD